MCQFFCNNFVIFVLIPVILVHGTLEDIFDSKYYDSSDISSIFTPGFQFVFMDTETQESSEDDLNFSLNAQDVYTAKKTGMIDGMAITHELAINHNHHYNRSKNSQRVGTHKQHHPSYNVLKKKVMTKKRRVKPPTVDYVDLNRNLSRPSWGKDADFSRLSSEKDEADSSSQIDVLKPLKQKIEQDYGVRINATESKSKQVHPEILVLFDYENTQRFNKNKTAIVNYLKVYFHGVNNRYGGINEPKISFRISGVLAVNSRKAQPYLEMSRLTQGGYDINRLLDNIASWSFRNFGKLPKHDIAHLITGEMMKTKSSSGKYIDSISGLAYLKGACWISSKLKKSMAVSIAQDIGGFWDGVFTSAHELAHNLGASHDGSKGNLKCPWNDGHIMSYTGWGTTNKFFFSSCSINAITQFIRSSEGSCLLEAQTPTVSTYEAENPGDKLDMTMLCKRYTGNALAYVDFDTSPSDLCKNLVCRYPDGKDGYYLVKVNHPPGDNSKCGYADRGVREMEMIKELIIMAKVGSSAIGYNVRLFEITEMLGW